MQLNVQSGSILVSEQAFERLSEEVESNSELESDEEAQQARSTAIKTDLVTKILARTSLQAKSSQPADQDESADGDAGEALDALQMRAPLLWFVSKEAAPDADKLPQTQLGFHRNVFPDPGTSAAPSLSPSSSVNDWYAACIASMQAGRITRKGSKQSAWKGKRIKSKEVQDAAKSTMMTVLDGEGFIPGLSTAVKSEAAGSSDEDEAISSGSEDGYSSDDNMTSSTISRNFNADPPLRMWTVLLLGGGHFAASVIALNPHVTTYTGKRQRGATDGPREERSLILLAHKAFHRYTTRRKQGGGQAAQDATGRFAKSAGAQLRRYNEAALGDDVRGLLDAPGWRELISRSEKIWIRAGARAARGLLWSWEGAKAARGSPLEAARNDGRLGSLPFPTRRPTIGETVRCFLELSKVKVEHKSEEQLAAEEQEALEQINQKSRKEADARRREEKARERASALEKSKAEKSTKWVRLTEEEQAERTKWTRLVEMVRKNRTEALMTFLEKNEEDLLKGKIDARLPDWLLEQEANEAGSSAPASRLIPATILQLAAEAGSEGVVRYLLEDKRADPTLPTERLGELRQRLTSTPDEALDLPHRTAYDLTTTKEVRNIFRRLMADHPSWYDWGSMSPGGARVPSALTEEMQDSQSAKQKDRRAAMREKARERASKAAEKQASAPPAPEEEKVEVREKSSHHSTNRLGGAGAAPRALLQQRDEQQGLTPEMRARIEREKRARAAEERMKALMNK